jgi:cation:H+ antiporter
VLLWLQFFACAAAIAVAGAVLSRNGDVIAEKTGLSRSWIGVILLASITSLPELITGISAVTVASAPNIAVGDVFGSCVFNLSMLAVVDFLYRSEPVYRRAAQGHILSAGFGILLIGFAGLNLLLGGKGFGFAIGHIGLYSFAIVLLYAVAMRTVFAYERRVRAEFAEDVAERYPDMTLRKAIAGCAVGGAVVAAAGTWLPFLGADLAVAMGWSRTFVGTLFVAAATSLPELAVTIGALRLGAIDLAIAGLLGSNLFDIFILAIDDIAFVDGPILAHVSQAHAVSAMSALVMTGIVVVGLLYRPQTRLLKAVGWVSLGLVAVYLLNAYVLFLAAE